MWKFEEVENRISGKNRIGEFFEKRVIKRFIL